jgi:FtsH-binding integral membrane protein
MSPPTKGNSSVTLLGVIAGLVVLGIVAMFLLFVFSGLVNSPLSVVSLVVFSGLIVLLASVVAAIFAFRSKRARRSRDGS